MDTIEQLTPPAGDPGQALTPRRRLALSLLGATLLMLIWALLLRSPEPEQPLTLANLLDLTFDPYIFGHAAQELIGPLVLLFLFSRTALFARAAGGGLNDGDRLRLAGVLIGGQLLVFLYQFFLIRTNQTQVTNGLLLVLVGGLLGGWRVGLGIGLVSAFIPGLLDAFAWRGAGEDIVFIEFLQYFVVQSVIAASAVWLGATVGLAGQLLGERRFDVWRAVAVGVGAELLLLLFYALALDYSGFLVDQLLSNLVVSGIMLAAVALLARNVQADAARQTGETARLQLAQANLKLTQTQLALTQAELRALHAQINPHFFFNALNTIRYFIRVEPQRARDLLTSLSSLFQQVLSAGEFVSLTDELSHVDAYLALEKARLEEHLQVVSTTLVRNTDAIQVPTLFLQPLVENAVIHGVGPREEGGTIHIIVDQLGDDLLVQVADDGAGFDVARWQAGEPQGEGGAPEQRHGPSIGLRNVDERLRRLYGEAYRLRIESAPGQGTRVLVRLPLNEGRTGDAHSDL